MYQYLIYSASGVGAKISSQEGEIQHKIRKLFILWAQ